MPDPVQTMILSSDVDGVTDCFWQNKAMVLRRIKWTEGHEPEVKIFRFGQDLLPKLKEVVDFYVSMQK